ncbi:MAG: hypothetical protein KJ601_00650 [Nanoarchaeota archaeon]|nr:hypothetical protein [Nanoarchaeota archaeon]
MPTIQEAFQAIAQERLSWETDKGSNLARHEYERTVLAGQVWAKYLQPGNNVLFVGAIEMPYTHASLAAAGVNVDSIALETTLGEIGGLASMADTALGWLEIFDQMPARMPRYDIVDIKELKGYGWNIQYDLIAAPNVLDEPRNDGSISELISAFFDNSKPKATLAISGPHDPQKIIKVAQEKNLDCKRSPGAELGEDYSRHFIFYNLNK